MKKLFLAVILISGMSFGQFFEQTDPNEGPGFFTDEIIPQPGLGTAPGSSDTADPGTAGGPTFGQNPGDYTGPPPDQGEDLFGSGGGPGNPGPRLPIDGWFWLLPAAGLALGYRLLRPVKKEKSI